MMDAYRDAIAFPILTFSERTLAPTFGYVFSQKWISPYESIVSMLWKFARMNALPGHVIVAQLAKSNIDPYEGVAASRAAVDMRRLRDALGLQLKQVRIALIPDSLSGSSSAHFRYCAKCLRRGYHGVMHQLNTVHECPIHRDALQVACPCCGRAAPYKLSAVLLDAPFRCAGCRSFYGLNALQSLKRSPFNLRDRVAVTRSMMRYYSS